MNYVDGLFEEFLTSFKTSPFAGANKRYVEIFVSPTDEELYELTKNYKYVKGFRWVVDTIKKKVFAFSGDFIHRAVIEKIGYSYAQTGVLMGDCEYDTEGRKIRYFNSDSIFLYTQKELEKFAKMNLKWVEFANHAIR